VPGEVYEWKTSACRTPEVVSVVLDDEPSPNHVVVVKVVAELPQALR
jgi:hypothetical protein